MTQLTWLITGCRTFALENLALLCSLDHLVSLQASQALALTVQPSSLWKVRLVKLIHFNIPCDKSYLPFQNT